MFGKLGRADTATDSGAGVDDRDDGAAQAAVASGGPGMTKDKLVAEMNKAMQIVGYVEQLGAADQRARR